MSLYQPAHGKDVVPFFAPVVPFAELARAVVTSLIVTLIYFATGRSATRALERALPTWAPALVVPALALGLGNILVWGALQAALPFVSTLFAATSYVSITPIAATAAAGLAMYLFFGGMKHVTFKAVVLALVLACSSASLAAALGANIQYLLGLAISTFSTGLVAASFFLWRTVAPPLSELPVKKHDKNKNDRQLIEIFLRVWYRRTALEALVTVNHYKELYECATARHSRCASDGQGDLHALTLERYNLVDVYGSLIQAYNEALALGIFAPDSSVAHFQVMNLLDGSPRAAAAKRQLEERFGPTTCEIILKELRRAPSSQSAIPRASMPVAVAAPAPAHAAVPGQFAAAPAFMRARAASPGVRHA